MSSLLNVGGGGVAGPMRAIERDEATRAERERGMKTSLRGMGLEHHRLKREPEQRGVRTAQSILPLKTATAPAAAKWTPAPNEPEKHAFQAK